MRHRGLKLSICAFALVSAVPAPEASEPCPSVPVNGILGSVRSLQLADGTLLTTAKVNINIDGYARAYHPDNAKAGALIHLCNAGQVFLPDGRKYHGSVDNRTCTGRFMDDVSKIRAAGWKNPSVGLVRWYGILGRDEARIGNERVPGITPVLQADSSGFYVSPTAFADEGIRDPARQDRYVNPLRISAAVIPDQNALRSRGIVMGSFGVAYDRKRNTAVPFVVGDFGPRVGEATPALARQLAGLPVTDNVTRATRFAGQVDEPRIIWMFFGQGGGVAKHDSTRELLLVSSASEAFSKWGGIERLKACAD